MTKATKSPWYNPYKFRLWLSTLDHELLNDRQKREVVYFAGWGPAGCDSWNYKLCLVFHRSRATIKRDLKHLEHHHLIDIRGALGKHRRIIAFPYPTKSSWMAESIRQGLQDFGKSHRQSVENRGFKNEPHQRRTTKSSINQQLDGLLYGESLLRFSGSGSSGTSASKIPYDEAQVWEQTRHKIIDQLVREGQPRESAITQANIVIRISIRQKQSGKKKSTVTTNPGQP